jgi:hypothetical protein
MRKLKMYPILEKIKIHKHKCKNMLSEWTDPYSIRYYVPPTRRKEEHRLPTEEIFRLLY